MIQANCNISNPTEQCDINIPIGHSMNNSFTTALSTYFILLIIGSLILNILLIYVIVYNRVLHSSANVFFVNLAIVDITSAIGVLPFDADFLLQGTFRFSKYVCGIKETVFMLSLPASVINLLLLTFDRFLLIIWPRKHREVFTARHISIVLVLSWLYICIVTLYPIIYDKDAVNAEWGRCAIEFPRHYLMYQLIANFSIPLIMILVMNLITFRIAKQHTRAEQIDISLDGSEKDGHVVALTVPSNILSAKITMVVVAECFFCWIIFIVLVISNTACNGCHPRWLTWTGNAVNYSMVVLNPVIYGLLNTRIRKVITDRYKQLRSKSTEEEYVLALRDESIHEC